MALALVTYMVLRIPSTKHIAETYTIGYGTTEEEIERRLSKDKNVLDFYKI